MVCSCRQLPINPKSLTLGRKIGRNQVRNLMQILVASVDATLLQLTGNSDSVVITLDNLRHRAPSPGATVDALLVQARTFTADLSNIAAYLQDHTMSTGPSCRRPQSIWRPRRPSN
jgi:hypothetical protein